MKLSKGWYTVVSAATGAWNGWIRLVHICEDQASDQTCIRPFHSCLCGATVSEVQKFVFNAHVLHGGFEDYQWPDDTPQWWYKPGVRLDTTLYDVIKL